MATRELVETLGSFLEFNYEFDSSKPSGYPMPIMDISLARELIGYNPTTSLRDGLKETWDWFMAHQDEYLQKQNYSSPRLTSHLCPTWRIRTGKLRKGLKIMEPMGRRFCWF